MPQPSNLEEMSHACKIFALDSLVTACKEARDQLVDMGAKQGADPDVLLRAFNELASELHERSRKLKEEGPPKEPAPPEPPEPTTH